MFSSDTAFDASDPRLATDIWELIITDWMETKSLRHISKVDSTRRSIVLEIGMLQKRQKYDDIIKKNYRTTNAHKMLKSTGAHKLNKQ